ncbi:MAG: DUF2007 domain-containing protein [Anaerolineales bacterium]
MSANEWTKVTVLNDAVEAEIVRGLLEANGIQVFLSKEAVGQVYGLSVGSASEVEVFVPKDQVADAKKLLDDYVKDLGNDQG